MSSVFVSYARENIEEARKVVAALRRVGHETWWDQDSMSAGSRWRLETKTAIERSRFFVALMSSASEQKRGFVQKELTYALEVLEEYPDGRIYFIPARLEECKPSRAGLCNLQFLDLFPLFDQGIAKLLHTIAREVCSEAGTSGITAANQPIDPGFDQALSFLGQGLNIEATKLFKDLVALRPDVARYRYFLVLSGFYQVRPKLLKEQVVRRAEEHLKVALHFGPLEGRYPALLALIKSDFYEMNGMASSPPSVDDLVRLCGGIDRAAIREICDAMPCPGNRVWEWLRSRT
jgi:hypothetical protein